MSCCEVSGPEREEEEEEEKEEVKEIPSDFEQAIVCLCRECAQILYNILRTLHSILSCLVLFCSALRGGSCGYDPETIGY